MTVEDRVRAILPPPSVPRMKWDWKHMERQVPRSGPPGISWERQDGIVGMGYLPDRDVPILALRDHVVLRNSKGKPVGIMVHWPNEVSFMGQVLEKAGAMSIWTAPNRMHRGVATKLLAWADDKWGIDWSAQLYTEAGWRLCARYLVRKLTAEQEAFAEVRAEVGEHLDYLDDEIGPCPNCGCNNVVLAVNSAYQPTDPLMWCKVCEWEGRRSAILGEVTS